MNTRPTINNIVKLAQQKLRNSDGTARLDAEILLAHVLKCSRTYLRTWPEHTLTIEQHDLFLKLLIERMEGKPIAYLTGKRDFWDMTLAVSPDTLIPRPETEHLVELTLEKIPADAEWRIADLGTGSGAIALAIARERPRCQIFATDTSADALNVARKNAADLQISNIHFAEGKWCEPLGDTLFDIIVSNPPYVHPDDPHLQQGDLRFEPIAALESGPDGLADIRTICTEARQHLRTPGWLLLEHGYDQGPAVSSILHKMGYGQIQTEKDLAQNDRVSLGCWEG